MVVKNDKNLKSKIRDLLKQNDDQIAIANLLFDVYTSMDFKGIKNKDEMMTAIYRYLEVEDDQEAIDFISPYIVNNLEKLDYEKYTNNAYAKAIKGVGKYKDCSLEYLSYEPYQIFPSDDISVDGYKEINHIGYFDKKFPYLALLKNNEIWMSLNPNEIKTMEPYIAKARGHVLVLGLGMGYVAYMMANKKEVKDITIIEKDTNVINIFNNLLWPSFNNKDKIKIVNDDAINYLKRKQRDYDYIFADIWHSPDDGLPLFLKIKKINRRIDCWLEVSMYALLRRCMFTLLYEQMNNYGENNYLKAKIATDEVINKLYFKTKNLLINNEEDLSKILSDNYLLDSVVGFEYQKDHK